MNQQTTATRNDVVIATNTSNTIKDRVHAALAIRDEHGKIIEIPRIVTGHQLLKSELIYWVRSYKTLLKYIQKEYVDIFKPNIQGSTTGTRYYLHVENIIKFLEMFDNNKFCKARKNS